MNTSPCSVQAVHRNEANNLPAGRQGISETGSKIKNPEKLSLSGFLE
jgi:hypothetical protein